MKYGELHKYFVYGSESKYGYVGFGDIVSFLEDNGISLSDDDVDELMEFILSKRNRFTLWPGSDEWGCWIAFTDMSKVLTFVTSSMSEYSRLFKTYGYTSNYLYALVALAEKHRGTSLEKKCDEQLARSFGIKRSDIRSWSDLNWLKRDIEKHIEQLQFGPDGTPRLKRGPKPASER